MADPTPPLLGTKALPTADDHTPALLPLLPSCHLCRQRKVKCDRHQPCSNCLRARVPCTFPPGAGRAVKRPRQPVDDKVLNRIAHLELTIQQLLQQLSSGPPTKVIDAATATDEGPSAAPTAAAATAAPQGTLVPEHGRLLVGESQSRYVGNLLWADLTESIAELHGMFLGDDSNDEGSSAWGSPDAGSPASGSLALGSSGTNASIFGFRSIANSLRDFHPPVELALTLFRLFSDNVAPVTRIFHTPSLNRLFEDAVVATELLDRETEALMFAIYYAAIISLDSDQCLRVVGESRATTLERFRFAAEQALARANLLNTQSTPLLQAALLYLSVLRSDDGTQAVSSLTALVHHIARLMGLHRDGGSFELPPFQTEMRRRIYHQVLLLDHRSNDYHGCESAVTASMVTFDTRWPLNVNDSDLSPDMTVFPLESDGFTDMTLVHVRCHALRVGWQISDEMRKASSFEARLKICDEHAQWNENYVKHWNPAEPLQFLALGISYIVAARLRFITYYTELRARKREAHASTIPNSGATGAPEGAAIAPSPSDRRLDTNTLRDRLFDTAVDILKRTDHIIRDERLRHWAWHSHTYIQWQVLALVASEICSRPPSLQCDEAWEYAKSVHDTWLDVQVRDDTERGNIFLKPMGLLMAEARRVRDVQQSEARGQMQVCMPAIESGGWPTSAYNNRDQISYASNASNADNTGHASHAAPLGCMGTSTAAAIPDTSSTAPAAHSVDGFDPFFGAFSSEVQNAWYQSIAQESISNPSDAILPAGSLSFP
ncbi:hypothetical protein F5Y17DRAFT_425318 [Xylariaceae sp. FL0594]|nr:hypothetical protein F5Y17DRAFT_425318 [Xylariaceae sp. FL0594]